MLLDTNIFDGVKQNRWGEVLGNYVYHKLAGRELTLYDENGWEKRTTYLQDLDGNIYEATLNIADGRDRRILYNVSRVHMIDKKRSIGKNTVTGENQRSRYQEPRTGPSQSDALANRVAENGKTVNREYSYKSDYEDYLNALEQDEARKNDGRQIPL